MSKFKSFFLSKYFKFFFFLFLVAYTVFLWSNYNELGFILKGVFYFYLVIVFLGAGMYVVSIEEYYLSRKPVKDELSYHTVKKRISKFPELKEIGKKHLIKTKDGGFRLSVLGMNLINDKYDELSNSLAEKQQKEAEVNDLVSDLFESQESNSIDPVKSS